MIVSCKPASTSRSRTRSSNTRAGVAGLRRQAVGQQRGRQTVVAVQPGQVLDQVGRPFLDVEPVRRHRRPAARPAPAASTANSSAPQEPRRLVRRASPCRGCAGPPTSSTRRPAAAAAPGRRPRSPGRPSPPACWRISSAARSAAGCTSSGWMPRLKRMLASLGRFSALHGAADAEEIEVGRLQQDVGRGRGHLRLGAAHDAGQGDGPGRRRR